MGQAGGSIETAFGRAGARQRFGGDVRARLIHLSWALIVSALMAVTLLLEPVDWMIWNAQSRIDEKPTSGNVVFVLGSSALTEPANSEQRYRLADALDRLRADGAQAVYLDVVFNEPAKDPRADARLRDALDKWGQRAALVNRIDLSDRAAVREYTTIPSLATGRRVVWNGVTSEWYSFTWEMPLAYRTSRGFEPSFAAALAGVRAEPSTTFTIDYGFRGRSVPSLPLARVAAQNAQSGLRLSGKTVVIGMPRDPAEPEMRVPRQLSLPNSFVPIFAAETLREGPPRYVYGLPILLVFALAIAAAGLIANRHRRRKAYFVGPLLLVTAIIAGPALRLHMELSYAVPLFLVYAALRWRAGWQQRVAQFDPDTGFPTFRALTTRLAEGSAGTGHIVVAKIHGYETILKTLVAEQRTVYVHKLVERLRVGDPDLAIYIDGHYLAWEVDETRMVQLRAHLEGLRAIFAAPVTVDGHSVDVGITFGAAPLDAGLGERSLAVGLAAVEETDEALEPVKVADGSQPADMLWDLSLRARIDAAMEAGEVFCVYQPKVDIGAGRLIGVEALVRWEDPERGFIPPLHFVMQCEKAGRMEYLTRYVLQSACTAGKLLHFRGSALTMSVNISATLLTDMRVVGIVRNVLQATGFDPAYLMLEITETARIRDLAQARAVLGALKSLGAQVSMDDFGSGAANFETLRALPFDEIKIDRQFISGASASIKARAIAESIVGLGASARIAVVAEGAETASDLQMLREIGCWQVQGYALSRPLTLTNLLNLLESDGPTQSSAEL